DGAIVLMKLPFDTGIRCQQQIGQLARPMAVIAKDPAQMSGRAIEFDDAILMPQGCKDAVVGLVVEDGIGMTPVESTGETLAVPVVRAAAMTDPVGIEHVEQAPFPDQFARPGEFGNDVSDQVGCYAWRRRVGGTAVPALERSRLCAQYQKIPVWEHLEGVMKDVDRQRDAAGGGGGCQAPRPRGVHTGQPRA